MDHLLNIRAIEGKMKDKPKSQGLYHFFWGATARLNVEQMKELKKIVQSDSKKVVTFIDKAIADKKKSKAA